MAFPPSFQISELSEKDFLKIPTILPNKVLMAPGTWNGVSYSADEIRKAYENTDWSDKDVISIILDHADKPLKVADWVGWIKNPRMDSDCLIGDLELYDEQVLIKLVQAKAKFGISPRVKGMEYDGKFKNYTYENFSVVTNPAVKKAYINLSQREEYLKGGKMETEKIMNSSEDEEIETPEDEEEEVTPKKKEKKPAPAPKEELSVDEMFEYTTMSDWTDFVAKMRKEDPKISFQEIAKAYKAQSKTNSELEQLSVEELLSRIETLSKILKKKKYPYPEEKMSVKENEATKKLNITIQEMSQKMTEMEKRLNEPDAKSVMSQELAEKDRPSMTSPHTSGVLSMAEYLQTNFLK